MCGMEPRRIGFIVLDRGYMGLKPVSVPNFGHGPFAQGRIALHIALEGGHVIMTGPAAMSFSGTVDPKELIAW